MTTLDVDRRVARLADILAPVGDIPLDRILWDPLPGTATKADQIQLLTARIGIRAELIDGILVEKPMSTVASFLAITLATILNNFIQGKQLGLVAGPDFLVDVDESRRRLPDVSFTSRGRMIGLTPEARVALPYAPDLAVEVLSPSNTAAEMRSKLNEYFAAGSRLVWIIDPVRRTCSVYTSPTQFTTLSDADTLTGTDVLPGFQVSLSKLFDNPDYAFFLEQTAQPE